jgi:hypothetical protein
MKTTSKQQMEFTLHTADILNEVLENTTTAPLYRPLQLLANLLGQVAQRASELHDEKLDKLMIQLTLYAVADPKSKEYDPEVVRKYIYPESFDAKQETKK